MACIYFVLFGISLFCGSGETLVTGIKKVDVAIVGSGAAGIAAASLLVENGVTNILVLEAEDRLGGRINTVPFGNSVVDMGAQFIHGEEGNAVYNLVKDLDLVSRHLNPVIPGMLIKSSGEFVDSTVFSALFARSVAILEMPELRIHNGSITDFFIPRYAKIVTELGVSAELSELFLDWFSKAECSQDACDTMSQVGTKGYSQYVDSKGDLALTWKSGGYQKFYKMFIDKALKTDAEFEQKLLLGKEVIGVDWEGDHVLLLCMDGSQYHADHVIFTPSLGVLKSLPEPFFRPQLPLQQLIAIHNLGYGTVGKIHLEFPNQWWLNNSFILNFGWLQKDKTAFKAKSKYGEWPLEIMGFYLYDNQTRVLTAWISGAAAREMEAASEGDVTAACVEVLNHFVSGHYNISQPSAMKRTSWFSNPHFKGSYSFGSIESDAMNVTREHLSQPLLNSNNDPIVMFAGEATHPYYFSTVHGALETGWREARRIIDLKQRKQTSQATK